MAICDICRTLQRRPNEACSKCLDCDKFLCLDCVKQHSLTKVTAGHGLVDIEGQKDIDCKVSSVCNTVCTKNCLLAKCYFFRRIQPYNKPFTRECSQQLRNSFFVLSQLKQTQAKYCASTYNTLITIK